ncbi:MAG TPA: lytic murein transglycosylase [Marinagarivorans sp.]
MKTAIKQSTQPQPFELFCNQFRSQRDAIVLLRQLHHMSKAVQRHRGMSMALLAGNKMFEGDFAILQRQVERRLATLEMFAAAGGDLLSERDQQNLHNAWNTISADWQNDDVIDNFELHSHFIEQLHNMIAELARKVERPVSAAMVEDHGADIANIDSSYPKVFKQIELLNFIAKQTPEMVEQLARMRGLATYAAAKGECEYYLDRKLRFALQCVRTQHEKLRLQAERMHTVLEGALPSVSYIKTYELKLMFLLNTVEMDVLSGAEITSSSHQLFKLATEIIDVYLKVAEDGFDVIAKWHDEDLEMWLA